MADLSLFQSGGTELGQLVATVANTYNGRALQTMNGQPNDAVSYPELDALLPLGNLVGVSSGSAGGFPPFQSGSPRISPQGIAICEGADRLLMSNTNTTDSDHRVSLVDNVAYNGGNAGNNVRATESVSSTVYSNCAATISYDGTVGWAITPQTVTRSSVECIRINGNTLTKVFTTAFSAPDGGPNICTCVAGDGTIGWAAVYSSSPNSPQLSVTTDGGGTWTPRATTGLQVNNNSNDSVRAIATNGTGSVLYYINATRDVLKSTDGGSTFTLVSSSGPPVLNLGRTKLYCSSDATKLISFTNSRVDLYVTSFTNLTISHDSGVTWEAVQTFANLQDPYGVLMSCRIYNAFQYSNGDLQYLIQRVKFNAPNPNTADVSFELIITSNRSPTYLTDTDGYAIEAGSGAQVNTSFLSVTNVSMVLGYDIANNSMAIGFVQNTVDAVRYPIDRNKYLPFVASAKIVSEP